MLKLLISVLLCFSLLQPAVSQELEIDPNKPLGDVLPIKEAVTEFQKMYGSKVMLPEYIPFKPTVSGGYVDELKESIRVDYLNEKDNKTLSLNAHVQDFKLKKHITKRFKLDKGINAKIINDESIGFIFISFKRDDLTYFIGTNKSKYNNIDEAIKELTMVANSLK